VADQDQIDRLIATYRELNMRVRPLSEERLRLDTGGGSVRSIIMTLRDRELHFSQALKDAQLGLPVTDMFSGEMAVIGTETGDENTSTILAQFGTARESTLAMLRSMPGTDWDKPSGGDLSTRQRVAQLLESDRQINERVIQLLGSPA
jgi:hypothetical protein